MPSQIPSDVPVAGRVVRTDGPPLVRSRAGRVPGPRVTRQRFVSSVREVVDAEGVQVISNEVYRPGPGPSGGPVGPAATGHRRRARRLRVRPGPESLHADPPGERVAVGLARLRRRARLRARHARPGRGGGGASSWNSADGPARSDARQGATPVRTMHGIELDWSALLVSGGVGVACAVVTGWPVAGVARSGRRVRRCRGCCARRREPRRSPGSRPSPPGPRCSRGRWPPRPASARRSWPRPT